MERSGSIEFLDRDTYISNPLLSTNQQKNTNLFKNGKFRIDYVLVYDKLEDDTKDKYHFAEKRKTYEGNLKKKGLLVEEYEYKTKCYVKIHAPNAVLKRYAEILKMRMPVKENVARVLRLPKQIKYYNGCCSKIKYGIGHIIYFLGIYTSWLPQKDYKITAEYCQNKGCLFDDDNTELFFSTSDRCMIVNFILEQVKFCVKHQCVGLTKLLEQGLYATAYPPHEGTITDPTQERGNLMKKWASLRNIFSYQPIDEIKNYFGMKFALYFAWAGFYTYMLMPPALFGLISVLYGIFNLENDILSKQICNDSQTIVMCPPCDKYCDYYKISDACWYYKIKYVIDNNATYVFTFLMSIWSALYLKLWKRYSAEITHRWGLTGFSLIEEHPRPSYESCAGTKKNDITKQEEPNVPFWTIKLPCLVFSYTLVLIWVFLVLLVTFFTILYSIFFRSSNFLYSNNKYQEIFFIPVTTAILNYIIINILNSFYNRAAGWLTDLEFQRTQVEFDNSLQLKIYLFQFVNNYFPIFYTAFFKGRFVGTPGKYIRIFGMRQEECDLGGCILEVGIQLATFMVCEQLFNNFVEYIWPHMIALQRSWTEGNKSCCQMFRELLKGICGMRDEGDQPRWIEDINLNPWDTEIFDEYLEMVVQYGFVTIFVTAFPLAPLLALFNNVFIEKHLDAKKFICNYRRPVAQRVPDIGIWFYIMKIIAKISIITNACIIASSSNLIPLLLYKFRNWGATEGFLNHSMSYFNVSKLEPNTSPINSTFNITFCRYPELRDENYDRTFEYWHILVAKLVFVVVYQNVVSNIVTILQWIISDTPQKLNVTIKKEDKHLSEQLLQEYEADLIHRGSVSTSYSNLSNLSRIRDNTVKMRVVGIDIEEEDIGKKRAETCV